MVDGKPLLILDLDHTLIHMQKYRVSPKILEKKIRKYHIGGRIHKRPHLNSFLRFCFQHFETAVWSAGTKDYVDDVVSQIFTIEQREKLVFIYSRDRCTQSPENLNVKNLKKVFRRKFNGIRYNRNRTLIVDDNPDTYCHNIGNAIPIPPFHCGSSDTFLMFLQDYLLELLKAPSSWCHTNKMGWW